MPNRMLREFESVLKQAATFAPGLVQTSNAVGQGGDLTTTLRTMVTVGIKIRSPELRMIQVANSTQVGLLNKILDFMIATDLKNSTFEINRFKVEGKRWKLDYREFSQQTKYARFQARMKTLEALFGIGGGGMGKAGGGLGGPMSGAGYAAAALSSGPAFWPFLLAKGFMSPLLLKYGSMLGGTYLASKAIGGAANAGFMADAQGAPIGKTLVAAVRGAWDTLKNDPMSQLIAGLMGLRIGAGIGVAAWKRLGMGGLLAASFTGYRAVGKIHDARMEGKSWAASIGTALTDPLVAVGLAATLTSAIGFGNVTKGLGKAFGFATNSIAKPLASSLSGILFGKKGIVKSMDTPGLFGQMAAGLKGGPVQFNAGTVTLMATTAIAGFSIGKMMGEGLMEYLRTKHPGWYSKFFEAPAVIPGTMTASGKGAAQVLDLAKSYGSALKALGYSEVPFEDYERYNSSIRGSLMANNRFAPFSTRFRAAGVQTPAQTAGIAVGFLNEANASLNWKLQSLANADYARLDRYRGSLAPKDKKIFELMRIGTYEPETESDIDKMVQLILGLQATQKGNPSVGKPTQEQQKLIDVATAGLPSAPPTVLWGGLTAILKELDTTLKNQRAAGPEIGSSSIAERIALGLETEGR